MNKIILHRTKMLLGFKCRPINVPNKTLISWEQLSSWEDPYYSEEHAQKNLVAFGKFAHIILVIREPKSYLSSVYTQLCLHELNVQKPEYFYLENEVYSERLTSRKFAIDKFSYTEIIDQYKQRFNNVTVVKFEHLEESKFISELFSINEKQMNLLRNIFKVTLFNKAFSKRGVKYTFALSKLLSLIDLSLRSYGSGSGEDYIDIIRNKGVKKLANPNIFNRLIDRFLKEFKWGNFIRARLDKLLPYEKYTLDFTKLKNINIKKLEKEYENIPNEITYSKKI